MFFFFISVGDTKQGVANTLWPAPPQKKKYNKIYNKLLRDTIKNNIQSFVLPKENKKMKKEHGHSQELQDKRDREIRKWVRKNL